MFKLKINPDKPLPSSASSFGLNLLLVLVFFVVFDTLKIVCPTWSSAKVLSVCLLFLTLPLVLLDLRKTKTFLKSPGSTNPQRLITKLIGFFATILVLLLIYRFCPIYWENARAVHFYAPFFEFIRLIFPGAFLLSVLYFFYMDRREQDPYDSYWHVGCLLTGKWNSVKWIYISEHLRVWFIKGFFSPFMFGLLVEYMNKTHLTPFITGRLDFHSIFDYLVDLSFTFDVIYGVLGYLLTVRILNNHIQSTEPTWIGWVVCLACYAPFYYLFGMHFLEYRGYFYWQDWLRYNPVVYYFWGSVIIFLSLGYGLSTVAFGYRMSNLTYRGLITAGPYRYTKHPAYLCKVLSWWMIFIPFYSVEGPWVAFKQSLCLAVISFVYWLRAKTEENHLANYPEYVEYAGWIDKYGFLRVFKKWFPAFKFSSEKIRRWDSVVWFKKI